MANSGAEYGGIQSVSAADSTINVTGGTTAPAIKANVGTTAGTVAAGNDSRFGKIGGVTVTGTPTAGQVPIASGPAAAEWGAIPGGSGTGDVAGPAGAVSGHVALFDGTTGKLLKDSGLVPLQLGTTADTAMPGDTPIPATPEDIGAQPAGDYQPAGSYATAAQGALADTALQPATGLVVVYGGADPDYPRPAGVPAGGVKWVMEGVAPNNGLAGDDGYGW